MFQFCSNFSKFILKISKSENLKKNNVKLKKLNCLFLKNYGQKLDFKML